MKHLFFTCLFLFTPFLLAMDTDASEIFIKIEDYCNEYYGSPDACPLDAPATIVDPLFQLPLPPSVLLESLEPKKRARPPIKKRLISYECQSEACDKRFNTKQESLNHFARMHQEGKPFACDICSAAYSTISSRRRHTKRIHGEKCFNYTLCQTIAYATRGDLNQHMKRKHHLLIRKYNNS